MDHHFLTEVSEAFLVTNDVYSKFSRKEVKQIRNRITDEVMSFIKELRETDLELYDMLWDRSKIFQQQVITDYLTLSFCDEETINEIGVMTTATILGAIAGALFRNKITTAVMKKVESLGTLMEKIGMWLVKRGRFAKFRYAIIQRNAQQCYKRCGVREEDITSFYYVALRKTVPTKKGENIKCLRECYITQATDSIVLLLNYYFVCIKKQNAFPNVDRLKSDDILKVLAGVPLAGACKEFFDEVKKSFDTFYDLLDFVYKDNDQEKQKAISILKNKVINIRNEISKAKDFKKYQ